MRRRLARLVVIATLVTACGAEPPMELAPLVPVADGVYHAVAVYSPPFLERRDTVGVLHIEGGRYRTCELADSREVWLTGSMALGYRTGVAFADVLRIEYAAPQPDGLLAFAEPLGSWVELWEPAPQDDPGCAPADSTSDPAPDEVSCDDGEPLLPPGTVLESLGTGPQDWRRIAIGETHLVECGPEWRAHAVPYRWRSCDGVPSLEVRLPAVVVGEVELLRPDRVRISHPRNSLRMEVIDAPEGCGELP